MPTKVMAKMKEMPTDDPLFGKGQDPPGWPQDSRHVPVRGQEAGESKGEWDLYKLLATIPAEQAFRPLSEGGCPLVKG